MNCDGSGFLQENRIPEAQSERESAELASNRCPSLTQMQNWQALNSPFLHGPKPYQGQWNLRIFSSTSASARQEVRTQIINLTRKINRLLTQLEEDLNDR